MKERNAVAFLLNLNVIVIYSAAQTLKLVELVIMSRENGPSIKDVGINDIFDDRPCD